MTDPRSDLQVRLAFDGDQILDILYDVNVYSVFATVFFQDETGDISRVLESEHRGSRAGWLGLVGRQSSDKRRWVGSQKRRFQIIYLNSKLIADPTQSWDEDETEEDEYRGQEWSGELLKDRNELMLLICRWQILTEQRLLSLASAWSTDDDNLDQWIEVSTGSARRHTSVLYIHHSHICRLRDTASTFTISSWLMTYSWFDQETIHSPSIT